jgi:hypothetical protein
MIDHPILMNRQRLEGIGRVAPWIVLLDIDSTLMDTSLRNVAILEAARRVIPGLGEVWPRLDLSRPFYGILEPFRRAGIEDPTLLRAVRAFWNERFFTDEWLAHDRPYPGVPAFLHGLKEEGFTLAYLTGRHVDGMEKGTRRSFIDHGLPAGPEEIFFFKPDFAMSDQRFKASVRERIASMGTLVVSIDNEPANANLFHEAFPEALVVWLDTVTSPDPEPLLEGIESRGPEIFIEWDKEVRGEG